MGNFANPTDVIAKTRLDSVKAMDPDDVEDLLIVPAEDMLEVTFKLNLNTDAIPYHMEGTFESNPRLQTRFLRDMRRCVILLCDRLAINPHGYTSQTVRGASVSYGSLIPSEVSAIMARWARPRRLFRV